MVRPTCPTFLRPFFIFQIFFFQIVCIRGTESDILELPSFTFGSHEVVEFCVPLPHGTEEFWFAVEYSARMGHRKWWLTCSF